jgi:hypothetical protein
MRYDFQINFLDPSLEETCFFCGGVLSEVKIQVFSTKPTSANILIIDYSCLEQLTALGLKALWQISPAKMETQ